jgi:hypothetical protein
LSPGQALGHDARADEGRQQKRRAQRRRKKAAGHVKPFFAHFTSASARARPMSSRRFRRVSLSSAAIGRW